MLIQLPEEKKESIFTLFKNPQPDISALWCYFEGKKPGITYVDNIEAPTKAICRLDMSWTFISDNADFKWIEETLQEIIKQNWIQVIWVSSRRPDYPLKNAGKIIPRLEFIERKPGIIQPKNVQIKPFSTELFDKLENGYKNWHIQNYGSKEEYLKNAFGFYAIENGEICCECESVFTVKGFTEIGVYTFEKYRRQGYAFAACFHILKELDQKRLKVIWSCDAENEESTNLAEKLGFINPIEYDFIYFHQQ